ncbi:EAL domain-containing protein [Pseudoxanthomonas sp. SL93]|uniref:EAL domain-containing protein n=1 Tax=Pseudoxanthomonas sp. SL93 TaxID=2995142 RepID=UPI00227154EA|nr:EAL domain-containing protein [Pseudoxanthomonas sp. SL93]WAC64420.1 EAL domain-containing protein [Pseudoxanthomonas sp. SL93]
MSTRSVSADNPAAESALSPADRIVSTLRGMLPDGAELAVCWRDWALGNGAAATPSATAVLRKRAEQALADTHAEHDSPELRVHAWDNADGNARIAVAVSLPHPLPPAEEEPWLLLARTLLVTSLDAARAQARIVSLEKSKRLQQALYEIADLAGADLEMPEMLRRIHAVVNSLMYAENCYIVLYDDQRRSVRFLYFADQRDPYVAEPEREFSEEEMANSMTFALLRHGQPLRGPSAVIRQKLGVMRDPSHGPDSLDWLGVPMRREDRVCGAIVVQSYDAPASYADEDRALLGYVAQHILTALDRKHAHVELEHRVEARTHELQRANRELQAEVMERKRAEKLQRALFRITDLAITSDSLERFYADVHVVVDELINARNFYIALVSDDGDMLQFPYSIDERDPMRKSRRMTNGLTEYVIATGKPLLADREVIHRLAEEGKLLQHGPPAFSWLGVPLFRGEDAVGAVVVQSYSTDVTFSAHDQSLLTFVAHHIGNGLDRQRAQERLRSAHAELERRVDERTRELAEANHQLRAQIGERLRAEQQLTYQATHDALTGLPNRPHLLDRLSAAIERARHGDGQAFAVLFLDLDRFKLVNDSMGHAAGDELLVEVARRITMSMHGSDMVSRLGGDEFAILVEYTDGVENVRDHAQRLLAVLGRPMWVAGRELFPSASLGIAIWHPRYRNGEELLRDADAAMYRAKEQGRDRCAMFDEAMREAAMQSLDLEADLRRAINHHDFLPFYQPIRRLDDRTIIGHEALLRWQHDRRGLLLPSEFIELGEDSGLIEQVDWLLYEQVVRRIAQGVEGYISVNVSPRHFRSPDFADRLLAMFEAHGADPSRMRVEITEVALLDDAPRTLRILRTLRQHGILAQLDDFGTGFSALSYLHRFPISVLKIDRSFIAGLGSEARPESLALVRAILALASTLGIETIAEGVETDEQRHALLELGCELGQGYLLGRPAASMTGGSADLA